MKFRKVFILTILLIASFQVVSAMAASGSEAVGPIGGVTGGS